MVSQAAVCVGAPDSSKAAQQELRPTGSPKPARKSHNLFFRPFGATLPAGTVGAAATAPNRMTWYFE